MQHNNAENNLVRIQLNHLFADFVIHGKLFNWLMGKFIPWLKTLLKLVPFFKCIV
ncbi:hypothetical protein O185_05860 [Photorhabdus temperata J3]|uniref:Uncharacterized protein n=1 Tax=Photorhabdus temperata J3 TaxID=1389415 RepID=U7R557_PHOTE|nr:hypothetical protein O185_05860 [Photorhabdus temperata J3]